MTEEFAIQPVPAGADQFGEQRPLGISTIAFKHVPADSDGVLILENTFHAKGGPARHLHFDQDEWFYAVEGEFLLEIGDDRWRLGPGDSILAPRQVPHVWAYAGDAVGRMLITFLPAGPMEAFFRLVTQPSGAPTAWSWPDHHWQLISRRRPASGLMNRPRLVTIVPPR